MQLVTSLKLYWRTYLNFGSFDSGISVPPEDGKALSDCCATGGSVSGNGGGRFADTFAPADPSLFDLSPTGKTGAGSVAADSLIAGRLMLGSEVPPHPANANVSMAIANAASIRMRPCAGLIKSWSSARHALASFFMVLSFGFVEVRYSIEDDVAAAISKRCAHLFY